MWTSAALGLASAVFYASNVLVNKFLAGAFSTSQAMFWHGIVATALGLALVPPSSWASVDPHAVAFLSAAAIGPGALGGLAFVWGLRRIPATHASTLTLLEPLVSLFLGAAVLGERVGAPALLGGFSHPRRGRAGHDAGAGPRGRGPQRLSAQGAATSKSRGTTRVAVPIRHSSNIEALSGSSGPT